LSRTTPDNLAELQKMLHAWQVTAVSISDPVRRAILTGDGDDFGRVPPPS
jgi:hypothetical protein